MQKAFDLTDEQIKRISDLRFEHEKLELDLKNKIAFNKLIIKKMMSDNEINENKLLELTQTNGELKTKIKLSETKLWIGIYNTLNDEQKEKWTKTFGHRFGKNGLKHKMGQYRFESENFNKFHIRKNVR
jgi:Spy/CpxP family protein refolding chaperone